MNVIFNGKQVNMNSLEFDNVFAWDYPDYCDAYVKHAEFNDGSGLTESEIDILEEKFYSEVRDVLYTQV